MKNKILTTALILFYATAQHTFSMGFWDNLDESFRKQKQTFKELVKQIEFSDILRSMTKNTTTNKLELEFNFAGFDKDEISVSINDSILKVSAERKKSEEKIDEDKTQNKKCIFKSKELSMRSKNIDLKGYNVDLDEPEKIESSYKNGILKIEIPLKKDSQSEIKIKIKDDEQEETK